MAADDPLEPMNRFFFDFNQRLDRHAALPAASFLYRHRARPGMARQCHNFLDNLGGPVNVANDCWKRRVHQCRQARRRALSSTPRSAWRAFSTSPPTGACPRADRDFGETLGVYGVPQGPYLVLPFRGPTAVRDFAGNYVDGYFSPLHLHVHYTGKQYVGLVKSTLGSVDNRSANIVTYPGYRARLGGFLRHHAGLLPPAPRAPGRRQGGPDRGTARLLEPAGTGFKQAGETGSGP